MGYLTTAADVKRVADLTNEYTNTQIENFISDVEYDIFSSFPHLKKFSEFTIDVNYDSTYYIGERGTDIPYKIVLLREEDETIDAGWTEIGSTSYSLGSYEPTITVPSAVQSGSDTVKYRVDWIPMRFHRLATLMTKKELITQGLIFTDNDASSVQEERLQKQIDLIIKGIKGKGNMLRSSVYADYEPSAYIEYEQYQGE